MKKRLLFSLAALFMAAVMCYADDPFRRHRENHFATIVPEGEHIVFIGNSITNMFEWRDGFGNASVLNRGISGAYSHEVLDNLESYIVGKPKKIFLMIGTNDLGTEGIDYPDYPATRVRKIVNRIRRELPETELYVQSILPSTSGRRTASNIKKTNDLLRQICDETGATYIDLFSKLAASGSNNMPGTYTYDDLHLTAMGYSVWCKAIESQVGLTSQFPKNTQNKNNGLSGAYGMRLTNFAQMPVTADDILMFGDEVQHGGEWAELLGNPNVKSRGAGWGYPGPDLATLQKYVDGTLKGRSDNQTPAKIFIYAGTSDLNSKAVATVATDYENLVKAIKAKAAGAELYLEAVIPNSNANTNTSKYVPFNNQLKEIAERNGATFIDTYTPLASKQSEYFSGNYLNGVGYAAMAEILAPYVGNCNVLTAAKAKENQALNNARNALGILISKIEDIEVGDGVGQYPESAKNSLEEPVENAYRVLQKGSAATVAELTEQKTALETALNDALKTVVLPKASTESDEYWYTFCSTLRGNRYLHANGSGSGLTGGTKTNFARMMWKFVSRGDGTFDIVNRADGSYISPSASYNAQIKTTATRPSKGWTLKPSSTIGMFIISSGTVELNQTNIANLPIYNWSSGKDGNDIADTGCQFTIKEAEGDPVPEGGDDDTPGIVKSLNDLQTGWYRLMHSANAAFNNFYSEGELTGRYVYNGAEEYRQNATNSYPLFLQTSPQKPADDDATYFIRIVRDGSSFFVQSADGHYLKTNATASRNAADNTAFSFESSSTSFHIGSHWVYFPSLENIMGMSSNGAFAANRLKIYSVFAENAPDLEAWQVEFADVYNASEVRNDEQISCTHSTLSGLSKVYNGGHFFLKKGVVPTENDFQYHAPAGESIRQEVYFVINKDEKKIEVIFAQVPDGIETIVEAPTDSRFYDVTGRRVSKHHKGVAISQKGIKTMKSNH